VTIDNEKKEDARGTWPRGGKHSMEQASQETRGCKRWQFNLSKSETSKKISESVGKVEKGSMS